MSKYNKLNLFLIIGYLISSFAFSITISTVYSKFNKVTEINEFYSNYNMLNISIKNYDNEDMYSDPIPLSKIINHINDAGYNQIILNPIQTQVQIGDNSYINDIWPCSSGIDIHSDNIIKGRYFDYDELNSNEKLAVIGFGLERIIEKREDGDYIKVFDDYYKVIGVIKDTELFKYSSIIPLKSLYFINDNISNINFLENYKQNTDIIDSIDTNILINKSPIYKVPVIKYLFKNVYELKNSLYQVILAITNLLLFSYFFSKSIREKAAIMKVLGARNIDVFKDIFGTFIRIASIGVIGGLLLSKITIDFMMKTFVSQYSSMNIENIIITCLLIFLISSVVSICVLFDIIRFKLMKEIR